MKSARKDSIKRLTTTLTGVFILLGCLFPAAAVNHRMAPKTQTYQIAVNNRDREYIAHIPASCQSTDQDCPVVLVFHGGGGSAKAMMREGSWTEKAEDEGFLAIFPDGTPEDPFKPGNFFTNPQSWNDGSGREGLAAVQQNIDDVAFVSVILDDLKSHFSIDESRIYVTGFSNGASISFRIARELSDRITAVAPVSGTDWMPKIMPDHPVPLLYITGTADPLNPIAGGEITIGNKSFGKKPAVQETIYQWVAINGYTNTPAITILDENTTKSTFGPEEAPGVVFYTLEGHGHHWPGSKSALPEALVGANNTTLNATDVIWKFFTLYENSITE